MGRKPHVGAANRNRGLKAPPIPPPRLDLHPGNPLHEYFSNSTPRSHLTPYAADSRDSREDRCLSRDDLPSHQAPSRIELPGGTPHQTSNAPPRRTTMDLPNSVRVIPVRLFVAALSLMCLPILAQNVVAKPAPTPAPAV